MFELDGCRLKVDKGDTTASWLFEVTAVEGLLKIVSKSPHRASPSTTSLLPSRSITYLPAKYPAR